MAGQMTRRTFLSVALASAGGAALSGCGVFDSGSNGKNNGKGGTDTLRQIMAPVPHLDPAMTGSGSATGNLLQTGLMEGLVLRDPDDSSKVLPGAAKSWDISADGTVYTFHLRSAKWSNGDPVTADDFAWNWQRLLSPATTANVQYKTSANADVFAVVGAADFHGGAEKDFSKVGVKALDASTVEFRLTAPSPLFLHVLAEWRTLPVNRKMLAKHPQNWLDPAAFIGNGPYVLSRWNANDGATLTRSASYWDAASYPVKTWNVTFNDAGDTISVVRFNSNETDLFMIQGDPGAVLADKSLRKDLVTGPASQFKCLIALSSKNPLLEDIRIRRALSLAIDRDAVAKVAAPDLAGGSLVPRGVPGYQQVKQTKLDVDQAKQLLADAGHPGGKGMPVINLLNGQPTPWLEAIGGMWQKNLGVTAKVDIVDPGVFNERRTAVQPANYVGFCFGYFGLTPPTLYKAVTWTVQNLASFALPGSAAEQYQALLADKKLAPADQAAQLQHILDTRAYPEYQHFVDLMKQAKAAANNEAQLQRLSVEALNAREDACIAIPVLWSGYTFMVKPSIKNLKITSYPDRVFTLRKVTVGS